MQNRDRRVGQCIFCAFRCLSRWRPTRVQRASLTTSLPLQREKPRGRGQINGTVRGILSQPRIRTSTPSRLSDALGLRAANSSPLSVRRSPLKYAVDERYLREVAFDRLNLIRQRVSDAPFFQGLQKTPEEREAEVANFKQILSSAFSVVVKQGLGGAPEKDVKLVESLRHAANQRGVDGIDSRLTYELYGHLAGVQVSESELDNQKALADLRYPSEWYPYARAKVRTVHLHVGPTNSGKTYQALKKLEAAGTGYYGGPLRLLAQEVCTRMNANGRPCALVTGEEIRLPDEHSQAHLHSCTVEMIPLNTKVDVAVIDEIQMIGDATRGWAWTAAVLGARASELHLCGEDRAVPLITELLAMTGDKLVVHNYERLSPLQMDFSSLGGNLKKLRKGDCIVSFSVMGIHALRREIERDTGKKVAIVYGSLPPETRVQQARLFNDPDNDFDFLVASDAIGMGLNLSIKRIIFESSQKFNGVERQQIPVSEIKQIAGRAGRYRVAPQKNNTQETSPPISSGSVLLPSQQNENVGLVTTLDKWDFEIVCQAMETKPTPIMTAGVYAPEEILERFANYFPPGTPFSYIIIRLYEICQMKNRFHTCGLRDHILIADAIHPVKGLTIADRIVFCKSPAPMREPKGQALTRTMAECVANGYGGALLDIPDINLEVLDKAPSANRAYLHELESLHKSLILYSWLSYRFSGVFTTRALCLHVKGLVEAAIEKSLSMFSFSTKSRLALTMQRKKAVEEELKAQAQALKEERQRDEEPQEQYESSIDEDVKQFGVKTSELKLNVVDEIMEDEKSSTAEHRVLGDDEDQYPGLESCQDHVETSEDPNSRDRSATQGLSLSDRNDRIEIVEDLDSEFSTSPEDASSPNSEDGTGTKSTEMDDDEDEAEPSETKSESDRAPPESTTQGSKNSSAKTHKYDPFWVENARSHQREEKTT